jgi:hypothetical protein
MLSSAVRVLDVQFINYSERPVKELRRIMEITPQWEELVLATDKNLPLAIFDDNTKLQLRRLSCLSWRGPLGRELFLDILPACTNLVEVCIPGREEGSLKAIDPAGLATATWVNRLEKYRGPLYPLYYLRDGAPLCHLTSTNEIPSPLLQRLGELIGQQLLYLLSPSLVTRDLDFDVIGDTYLPPSLIPSLFPNLRYIGWFLIMSQPESTPGNPVRHSPHY